LTSIASAPASRFRRGVFRFVPALDSLRHYSARSLRADTLAGLTVAAVAVPQAMAYAQIAGLPAQYGLYTAIVMTAVGALFDSSRQLINGPTNAISIALLSVIGAVAIEQKASAAVLIAFLVGAIQLGITLLRLGDLTRYISHSVIVGFTAGASMLLVLDQLKNLLGLQAMGGVHDHFLVRLFLTLVHGGGVHAATAAIGFGAIALVIGMRWAKRKLGLHLLPELLIVVAFAAWLSSALGLDQRGVKVVGEIPAQLPGFALPHIDVATMRDLAGGALAIALLGLLEAISMAKAIAAVTRQKLDMNQQCLSESLANLSGSFFQCMPGSGSLTRSAINQQAGAVTQWSGVVSAAAVALIMLAFAPVARFIPRAALAGILMVSAWKMVDWRALAYHLRTTRFDAAIVGVTALAAVFISIEFCVLIGVMMSFLLAVPRAGRMLLTEFVLTDDGGGLRAAARRHALPARADLRPRGRDVLRRHRRARTALRGVGGTGHPADAGARAARQARAQPRRRRHVAVRDLPRPHEMARRARALVRRAPEFARKMERTGLADRLGERVFLEQPVRQTSTLLAIRYAYDILTARCDHCPRRGGLEEQKLFYQI
jgi:SulP family sulfate permease